MLAIATNILFLAGCDKFDVYTRKTTYTIDATDKVSISFESKNNINGVSGAFFVSSDGIPAPETGTTYGIVEIPANKDKTIIIKTFFRMHSLIDWNKAWNINKDIVFQLPPLQAGSYTISYLFSQIGARNKRIVLKDSSGNVIQEIMVE
jgi:hypothetical protein